MSVIDFNEIHSFIEYELELIMFHIHNSLNKIEVRLVINFTVIITVYIVNLLNLKVSKL